MADKLDDIKLAVSDTMSDFYNDVMKGRFDSIDSRFDHVDKEISDLRLTSTTLVKIVDYARLEARILDLESRLRKIENKKN